jgi:uncharacterized protein HemY
VTIQKNESAVENGKAAAQAHILICLERQNTRAVQLRKQEAVHTKKWQEAIRLPAIFQFVKLII